MRPSLTSRHGDDRHAIAVAGGQRRVGVHVALVQIEGELAAEAAQRVAGVRAGAAALAAVEDDLRRGLGHRRAANIRPTSGSRSSGAGPSTGGRVAKYQTAGSEPSTANSETSCGTRRSSRNVSLESTRR